MTIYILYTPVPVTIRANIAYDALYVMMHRMSIEMPLHVVAGCMPSGILRMSCFLKWFLFPPKGKQSKRIAGSGSESEAGALCMLQGQTRRCKKVKGLKR